jgi:hypothetical protein
VNAGIHDIPADEYHADPAKQPSLSASIANILLQQSPAHARANHPRLNPNYEPKAEQKYDLGVVCHALLLEGRNAIGIVDADSWRTKDAQALRDAFRAEGKTPLLAKDALAAVAMCEAVRDKLARRDPVPFTDGKPEQTLVWQDGDVWCRARLDWLTDDHSFVYDLKTTSRSANPAKFDRTIFDLGYDLKAAFYMRAVEKLTGRVPEFRLIVAENSAPFEVSVIGLAPSALELANAKVDRALEIWGECWSSGLWPGYDTRTAFVEAPAWEVTHWLEREAMEAAA